MNATTKSAVRSSSLLETKRDARPNSKGIRENTTRNGAIGEQLNVMLGTVPQPQDSDNVLICLSPCSGLSHRINHHCRGDSLHLRFRVEMARAKTEREQKKQSRREREQKKTKPQREEKKNLKPQREE